MIRFLLRLRVKHLILKAFQQAEALYRLGNGEAKINYAVDLIARKTKMLPCFRELLREILLAEFELHKDDINRMIIREPIKV